MDKMALLEARISTHEQVCAERYDNINKNLSDLKSAVTQYQTQNHERFNGLSQRIWSGVVATLGTAVLAFGALAFWILTQGHGK